MTMRPDFTPSDQAEPRPPDYGYWSLFLRFLRFGLLAFGGPVAQIAMIRRELVDEEKWIGSERFNHLLSVMQALPGPEAHELCVHLGIRAKGRIGGVLAGLGFMLPGLVLMLGLAWLYTRIAIDGTRLGAIFLGVQAAVLAVILRAVHRIGEHVLVDRWLWVAALGAAAATLAGTSFWIVLPAAGTGYALASAGRYSLAATVVALTGLAAAVTHRLPAGAIDVAQAAVPGAAALFAAGLKAGLLTFGGAYTAIPFIRHDTVGRGWTSDAQFLDGLAISGVLPAPLVIFATFVGWVSGGLAGALAITAGMFLPAFAFSLLLYERLERITEHKRVQRLLSGVAAGVVGLIAVTLLDLAATSAARSPNLPLSALIFATGLVILYRSNSKYAPLVALAVGAVIGAVALH